MKRRRLVLPAVLLLFAGIAFAQQDQQQPAPPIGDQGTYPSETHKMSPAEKRDTASAHGRAVDLNTASKKDLVPCPE